MKNLILFSFLTVFFQVALAAEDTVLIKASIAPMSVIQKIELAAEALAKLKNSKLSHLNISSLRGAKKGTSMADNDTFVVSTESEACSVTVKFLVPVKKPGHQGIVAPMGKRYEARTNQSSCSNTNIDADPITAKFSKFKKALEAVQKKLQLSHVVSANAFVKAVNVVDIAIAYDIAVQK